MAPIDYKPTPEDFWVAETLGELGESELLKRLKKFAPPGQLDDDTAQINQNSQDLLINTDMFVDGIHFSDDTTTAEDVGWRAVAANLSDLAASGVDQIIGINVGLVAPAHTPWDWIEAVYKGMEAALNEFGGVILGGDCSNGQQKLLAITALGTLGPLRLHRGHARPGDVLVVSGPHGLSRLGLALLQRDPILECLALPQQLKNAAVMAHQRPQPALEALRALETCKPAELPWRAGGTDSSDGLLMAVQGLCQSSGCRAVLHSNDLPRAQEWPEDSSWDPWCLNGGEDFELVLSLPTSWARAWLKVMPKSQSIGYMEVGAPKVIWADGSGEVIGSSEFQHFKQN